LGVMNILYNHQGDYHANLSVSMMLLLILG